MADGGGLDELEYRNLQGAVASIEALISFATPDAKSFYERVLSNAQARLGFLEKTIAEHKAEVERQQWEQTASAAALAAKETKLSASERETYRGFLEESYFTKKDLGRLDEFYAHGYDRLSEGGKDEMSTRLHEGIRRGEFKLTELSQAIRERDNAHCSVKAVKDSPAQPHILMGEDKPNKIPETVKATINNINLGSVDLSGVKLADTSGSPSTSSLPDTSGSKMTQR